MELVEQPRFRQAQWGVKIVSLDTGVTLFAHQADKLFVPASNTKLYSGALALDRFGPDYRIRTSLYAERSPTARGVLHSDLILYGRGDPMIAARFHGGDLDAALAPLAESLARAGVRRIRGDLIADESFFRSPPLGSGWEWDDLQYGYGAEVSALTLNDNALDVLVSPATRVGAEPRVVLSPATTWVTVSNLCVTGPLGEDRDVRVGRPLNRNTITVQGHIPLNDAGYAETISVHRPAAWFGLALREALSRRGIAVTGKVRTMDYVDRAAAPLPMDRLLEVGSMESPPLRTILRAMMKPSQNQYAQLLLLQVGAAGLADGRGRRGDASPPPAVPASVVQASSAEEAGVRALSAFLVRAGIPAGEVLVQEGSGLTRRNLITPGATVQLLRFMDQHRDAEVFRESLPIAGVDGTLKNRMRDTAAAGNARAKTGSLHRVYTLSGYVTSKAGERMAFSIMLNHYANTEADRLPRADLDEIVVMLAALTWRS